MKKLKKSGHTKYATVTFTTAKGVVFGRGKREATFCFIVFNQKEMHKRYGASVRLVLNWTHAAISVRRPDEKSNKQEGRLVAFERAICGLGKPLRQAAWEAVLGS